jgi:hypothetical protein
MLRALLPPASIRNHLIIKTILLVCTSLTCILRLTSPITDMAFHQVWAHEEKSHMSQKPLTFTVTHGLLSLEALLLVSALPSQAQLPALWPTFSQPTTEVNVNLYGTIADPGDQLAETTLQGAYNQLQGSTRLYLNSIYADSPGGGSSRCLPASLFPRFPGTRPTRTGR